MEDTKILVNQNSRDIEGIIKALSKIEDIMMDERKTQYATLEEMKLSSAQCQMRHEDFMKRLDKKALDLDKLWVEMDNKASKEEVRGFKSNIHKAMWILGIGIAGYFGTMFIDMSKSMHTVEKVIKP